ncbi:MAG: Inositol-1-monophosphatase [Planctomycetes bacterium ADurb.Bin401]|nr:MAG: Inositol-1-monophosphatase [Planctomycetes bacterium ADurb.Bin401]
MIEHKDIRNLLEVAEVAARLAGQRAMEDINYVRTSAKSSTELVTEADARCQQIIIDNIMQSFSSHGIVAEEGKDNKLFKQPPRGDNDFWWIIDPIDGTNNYSQRILSFAVSIGVMCGGKPILGVIFDPATDSMFTAAGDAPPQLNNIRIAANDNDIEYYQTIGIESLFDKGVPGWITKLQGMMRCRSLGTTALHLAYVAKGSFVAGVMNNPRLWDIAAGAFLAEAAGAIVTDWQGKSLWPVDVNAYNGEPFQVLAANKRVHGKLVELINQA